MVFPSVGGYGVKNLQLSIEYRALSLSLFYPEIGVS